MSLIYTSCVWATESDIIFPSSLLESIQDKLTKNLQSEHFVWRHFGGVFAQNLYEILGDYPQASTDEKTKAVVVGSELSFRFSLGSFFAESEELQVISNIVFEMIVRGRLEGISAKQLGEALALGLEKMPRVQLSFSADILGEDAMQRKLLSAWVRLCLQAKDKVFWRPELFLSGALSGLGNVWLSEQILWTAIPSMSCWYSALAGLEDIYIRHLKAADKRLRPDQIISIDVALPHFLATLPKVELQKAIAHYCINYSWDNLNSRLAESQELLSKIQIYYSTQKSFEYWEKCIIALPNLFAGVSERLFEKYLLQGFLEKRKLRKLLSSVKYSKREWKTPLPKVPVGFSSSIVIYTSRGGKWTSISS